MRLSSENRATIRLQMVEQPYPELLSRQFSAAFQGEGSLTKIGSVDVRAKMSSVYHAGEAEGGTAP